MKRCLSLLATAGLLSLTAGLTGCQAQLSPGSTPTTVSGGGGSTVTAATVALIDAHAAEKLIADEAELQVLDVRTPDEVAGGVIAKPTVINWHDGDFMARAESELDKSKPLLVYCKAGGRSAQAASALLDKGFTNVYNLDGGITAWTGAGLPVQK